MRREISRIACCSLPIARLVGKPQKEALDVLSAVGILFELEEIKKSRFAIVWYGPVRHDLVLPFDRDSTFAVGADEIDPPTAKSKLRVRPENLHVKCESGDLFLNLKRA